MDKEYSYQRIPSMGEGIQEVTIVKWLVNVGDQVEKDTPLLEVSTDKVDTEISASSSGFMIAHFAEEGDLVSVDQAVAQISSKSDCPLYKPSNEKTENQHEASSQALSPPDRSKHPSPFSKEPESVTWGSREPIPLMGDYSGKIRSSPLVRRMAFDLGIPLQEISGSGSGGRVTRQDLEKYVANRETGVLRASKASSIQTEESIVETRGDGEFIEGIPVRRVKMSPVRKLTAEHMLRSVRTSPHVTTTFEIDMENILKVKEKAGAEFSRRYGIRLTVTPFMIFAANQALREYPQVNSSVEGNDILFKDQINIGCAAAIESGLIVPVIREVNEMSIAEIAQNLNSLLVKAKKKQLNPSDLSGGTFSITNPGMYGCLHSQPIINQPQVAILSVGKIVKRPTCVEDQIQVRAQSQVGLTFDHRVIDGKDGALFLQSIDSSLQQITEENILTTGA